MKPRTKKGTVLTIDGKRYTVTCLDKVYKLSPPHLQTSVIVEAVLIERDKHHTEPR